MFNRTALLLTFAAASIWGTSVQAQTTPNARPNPDANNDGVTTRAEATAAADTMFQRMDANRDGRLTPEDREQMRIARQDQMFARMDADSNGAVTRAEFNAAQAARQLEMQQRRSERQLGTGDNAGAHHGMGNRYGRGGGQRGGRSMGNGMGRGEGAGIDLNRDDAVTRDEFVARALTHFDRVDANSDGNITTAERQELRGQRMQRRRGGGTAPGE